MTEKELLDIIEQAAIKGETSLDLSNNDIKSLPAEIGKLSNLTKLNLSGNELSSLPAEIGKLSNLTELCLSFNQLSSLPAEIGQLTNLTVLWVQNNHLISLPAEIGKLSNLKVLWVHDNHLISLPAEIGKLSNLKVLWLRYNKLTSLPAEIRTLRKLTELDLLGNQLSSLPEVICKLTNLTRLYLGGNQLSSLLAEIGQLTKLTKLHLNDNQLSSMPTEIGQLTSLTELYLYCNQLSSLPAEIGRLTKLTELSLSHNQLSSLPAEIGRLTKLTKLHLSDNQFSSLPAEIGQLANLTELNLFDNQLTSPPPEVVKQGTKAILAYLRGLAKSVIRYWRGRLFLVGDGAVGKTSLLRTLCGNLFEETVETTQGIDIDRLELAHPSETGLTMELDAWDFGGQQIYHATHQFFLTNRALFVLVWDAQHGWEAGNLYNWLDRIQVVAPDSPVMVVATHIDKRAANLPLEDLRKKYPQIVGHYKVSNKTREGIEELKTKLAEVAAGLPQMGEQWPTTWAKAANEIRGVREKYLPTKMLLEIMAKHTVKGENAQLLARLLHELGDILYFAEDEKLNELVILHHAWLTHAVLRVVEDKEIVKSNGIVTRDHIDTIWADIENKQVREYIAVLMEKFGIWYSISAGGDSYLVVSCLPPDRPEYIERWDSIRKRKGFQEISMKFVLSSIPEALPMWFIVRAHKYTTGIMWLTGGLFAEGKEAGRLGLFTVDLQKKHLMLAVRGTNPREFFSILRCLLEQIIERFPGLKSERMLRCPGHNGKECSYEFNLKHLEIAKQRGREHVECPEGWADISIDELLETFIPREPVTKMDFGGLRDFARRIAERETERYEAKLLIVGEARVGKTELVKALKGEEFGGETPTEGILIRTLDIAHPKEVGVKMQLNLWDFGGQEIQHATHQFFYSERALFVLLLNASENYEKAKLNDWLELIQARASRRAGIEFGGWEWRAPMVLVATHCDFWRPDIPYQELEKQFPGIQFLGMVSVSNKPPRMGIEELKTKLAEAAGTLPVMGMHWPKDWQDAEYKIAEHVEKAESQMTFGEVWSLMGSVNVSEESREPLLRALDAMGKIRVFLDDDELRDTVVLDPQWLTNRIARVLKNKDAEEKPICRHAILHRKHWSIFWPEEKQDTQRMFVQMMRNFDLVYELEDSPEEGWLVVQLLPYQLSEADAKRIHELWLSFKNQPEIGMKFRLEQSIPPGIPTWFTAREHRFSLELHWRLGVLLADEPEKPRHLGLVQSFPEQRYVQLLVRGPMPHNFFALLRDGLELTLKRFPGLKIKRMVPCPGHEGKECEHEFEFENLEGFVERKQQHSQCQKTGEIIAVNKLLYGIHESSVEEIIQQIEKLRAEIMREAIKTRDKLSTEHQQMLVALQDNAALLQRGFTVLFNAQQQLTESHCPNVFAVLPKDERGWLKNILGEKMVLQLFCQAPGQWHPAVGGMKGGRYEIKRPAEFLKEMGPYILKLAKVIKYAAPVAGAAAGLYAGPIGAVMGAEFAKKLTGQIKLMEELAKKLSERDYLGAELLERAGGGTKAERIEGAELRALRKLLDKEDKKQEWGGLKKVLTPEGHYLWLCEEHAAEYKK